MITAVGPVMLNKGNIYSFKKNSGNKHEDSNVSFKSIPLRDISIGKVISQAVIWVGGIGTSLCATVFPFLKSAGADLGHLVPAGGLRNFANFCSDSNPLMALGCACMLGLVSLMMGIQKHNDYGGACD